MKKGLIGFFGVVTGLGIFTTYKFIKDAAKDDCYVILSDCEIQLERIMETRIEILNGNQLNDDEKAMLDVMITNKSLQATNIMIDGKAEKSIFKAKKKYKEAYELFKKIAVNLAIGNYGWFYN